MDEGIVSVPCNQGVPKSEPNEISEFKISVRDNETDTHNKWKFND